MAQWFAAMRERGHELRLVSPAVPRPELVGVTVPSEASGGSGGAALPARIRNIRRQAEDFGAQIYHAHYATDYAFWLALSRLRPLMVTCWGSDVLLHQPPLARFKRRVGLRAATLVTATSRFALDRALHFARPGTRGEVVHWGVDLEEFHPAPAVAREQRPFTVVSLRNLRSLYNIDVVIRAFAAALGGSGAVLRIAGDGSERTALEALTAELGIAEQVAFLGMIAQHQVAEELRGADVCVSVPSSDASAVSNLEALASGTALVASDLPSTREWVEPGVSGILVSPRSIDGLSRALAELAFDDSGRARIASAGHRTALDRAARSVQMDRASALYDELAAGT